MQESSHTEENCALNNNFLYKFVVQFILTGVQRVKTGLFY